MDDLTTYLKKELVRYIKHEMDRGHSAEKIKKALGAEGMAMPPYFGAFATKEDAEIAQKKYGGEIAKGLKKAIE